MYREGVINASQSSDGVVTGIDLHLVPLAAGVALLAFSWRAIRRVMEKPEQTDPDAELRRAGALAALFSLALAGLALALSGVLTYS